MRWKTEDLTWLLYIPHKDGCSATKLMPWRADTIIATHFRPQIQHVCPAQMKYDTATTSYWCFFDLFHMLNCIYLGLLLYKMNCPCKPPVRSPATGLTRSHSSRQRKKKIFLLTLYKAFKLKKEKCVCNTLTDVCFQPFLPIKQETETLSPENILCLSPSM